jgi:hypothetical protein
MGLERHSQVECRPRGAADAGRDDTGVRVSGGGTDRPRMGAIRLHYYRGRRTYLVVAIPWGVGGAADEWSSRIRNARQARALRCARRYGCPAVRVAR